MDRGDRLSTRITPFRTRHANRCHDEEDLMPMTQKTKFERFAAHTSGATAIEYALIIALMTLIVISGISRLGTSTQSKWNGVAAEVEEVHTRAK